jgi:acyl carrier protein phosphodiesterase
LNFLAHLLLADDSDASRIGNLLGDFTRGPLDELAKVYPPEVVRGIFMHRAVDRYTDSHSAFKRSRAQLNPERRRFAGIIVDLIYDHFLSVHWEKFSTIRLEDFCQQAYRELEAHPEWQAGRLSEVLPVMKRENWLMRYSSIDGMRLTMSEVSQRSPRISKMAHGIDDLLENYDALEEHFMDFMPDLLSFVASWKEQH